MSDKILEAKLMFSEFLDFNNSRMISKQTGLPVSINDRFITVNGKEYYTKAVIRALKYTPSVKLKPDGDPGAVLRNLLKYDEKTGRLFWKRRGPERFAGNQGAARSWNSNYGSAEAFASESGEYLRGSILGVRHYAHVVIWCMKNDHWPKLPLEHIDGDGFNNRLNNLMYKGVRFDAENLQWRAFATNGSHGFTYIELYDTFEEAVEARLKHDAKGGS